MTPQCQTRRRSCGFVGRWRQHKLAPQIVALVNELLGAKGLLFRVGTVVDATLIAVPSSTKNASGERDPEMKQSQKRSAMVHWHEGSHRRGCRIGPGAHSAGSSR